MKKFLVLILTLSLIFSIASCNAKKGISTDSGSSSSTELSSEGDAEESEQGEDVNSAEESKQSEDVNSAEEKKTSSSSGGKQSSGSGAASKNQSVVSNDSAKPANEGKYFKTGTKKIEDGLNFGGKTFEMACGIPPTNNLKRLIKAFEEQFKCTIKVVNVDYNDYVQQAAAKKATGKSYDILELEQHRMPHMVSANLCNPLEGVTTTADLISKTNAGAGGLSEYLSEIFEWKNHLYGVTGTRGYYGVQPTLVFYNKKLLADSGVKTDPRELYDSNKWTFDALKSIADTLQKSNVMLAGRDFFQGSTVAANGGWYVTQGANPQANLTNQKVLNAYKYIRTFTAISKPLIHMEGGTPEELDRLISGKQAFCKSYIYNFNANANISKRVSEAQAFGRNVKNLGIVPFPKGPDNPNYAKSCSWIYGLAAGVGADPRLAVAYAKFSTTYKDTVKEQFELSAEDQKMFDSICNGAIIYYNASFSDGKKTAHEYIMNLEWFAAESASDVAQLTAEANAQIKNCITVAMK